MFLRSYPLCSLETGSVPGKFDLIMLDWLVSKPQGSTCLSSLSTGITKHTSTATPYFLSFNTGCWACLSPYTGTTVSHHLCNFHSLGFTSQFPCFTALVLFIEIFQEATSAGSSLSPVPRHLMDPVSLLCPTS